MTNVYMLDLWCQVPFYDAYLCQALQAEGVHSVLGSTTFHLEPDYFQRRGLKNDPGLSSLASGLKIGSPKVRRSLRFLEFCGNLSALSLRFLVKPPDIIHVQWIPLVAEGVPLEMWFLKLAKRRGSKLVYTVHNLLPHDSDPGLHKIFAEVYNLMDALICHTQETKDRLIEEFGLDGRNIWVIPHGPLFYDYRPLDKSEAKRQLGFSPEQCLVLYQGLVRPYKGIDFLLDAWAQVQSQQPNARLVIAGRGEQCHMDTVKAKVEAIAGQSSVRLDLRYITSLELPIYYQAADIAVYPHREITQSGALLTGIAFGKPIVATTLPGFREALEDYQGAVCVEYGDVNGFSQLLVRLIVDERERDRLANPTARQEAEMSWQVIARQTRGCYEDVLRGTPGGAQAPAREPAVPEDACETSMVGEDVAKLAQ
ncbi:MAG TPA: glycosyltransferase family 4 protein [Terriglobales bacterium]|jgi:glycosyltransferase involved in cell wall biosynthesis|nr:glycosyltransferase family 4 protein [Terriglobales bacterium]